MSVTYGKTQKTPIRRKTRIGANRRMGVISPTGIFMKLGWWVI